MFRYFKTLGIAAKLWLLVACFSLVVLSDNVAEMVLDHRRLRAEKELQLRQLVESAHSLLQSFQREAASGRIAADEARRLAIRAVRTLRYGEREYFWIHDLATPVPHMVMHPTVPELDGQLLDAPRFDRATAQRTGVAQDYRSLTGSNLFVAMNEALAATGDGFVAYDWPKPLIDGGVSAQLYPKLSYVKRFEPWGWVIGSGIYIDDLDSILWRDMQLRILKAALWLVLLGVIVWAITRTVVKPLRVFQANIEALRKNPDRALRLPSDQPGELGQLATSFLALMGELRASRAELHASLDQLRLSGLAFANMAEGVVITDAQSRIVSVNPAFTRISGYPPEEVIGKNPSFLQSGRHDKAFYRAMWEQIGQTGSWSGEVWNRGRDNRIYPEWLSISTSRDEAGALTHYVGVLTDITERKHAESQIRFLAEHDALTELPNRVLMIDRLEQMIQKAVRNQTMLAVLFLDLDHFKNINDTLGHAVGDELLRQVALRISAALRLSDTLSRTGGDEFIILLPDLHAVADSARVTEAILERMSQPFALSDHDIVVSASIGIAIFPNDGDTPQRLVQCADMAMYHSKESGRNNYHFYTDDMNVRVFERMSLEHRLRLGLERQEFLLHYQPQVSASSGEICGVEALARWNHPELGMIPPGRFIPVAEDSGLILKLGHWVLTEACRQAEAWRQAGIGDLIVAVNVSAIQFREPGFVDTVRAVLAETGLPPHLLELELTESLVMNRVEHTIARLQELKDSGVKLSIDDFGTGYSALTYLKRFPIDRLKIDQSFVRGTVDDPQDAAIIRAIIALADSLGLVTIAEGVESAEVCGALRVLGCHEIQGYFYARPQPAAEVELLIRRWDSLAALNCRAAPA
ncbi:MAG TPA: EAL domain-containing protein [Rhodocyclaceae bacterium]|nr:EAL domain-containing protein [Rhodocyclaceae bacterium]